MIGTTCETGSERNGSFLKAGSTKQRGENNTIVERFPLKRETFINKISPLIWFDTYNYGSFFNFCGDYC
jgi:hypothetical protein